MARKTREVVVTDGGRDDGKHFIITELPASQAERWAARALMAMVRADVELPEDFETTGIAGLVTLSLRALSAMPFPEAAGLLDEMMDCVEIVPDPSRPMVKRRLIEDDIEEVSTRLRLRREIVELHTNFSFAGDRSSSDPSATVPLARAS